MEIKIGIIGTNFISDQFCSAALQVPGIILHAVYSRHQDTGDAFAQRHSIPHVYTDYDRFLSSDLDAVYIASPNFAHCGQALKAMEHKKHVLCEKVMALNEKEVRSMIECAQANHVILLEAMRPDFDPALELVEKNLPRIGTLRRASFEYCQYSSRYDSFRQGVIQNAFNPDLGNAAVMDIGVYCIHCLVRFFGMPSEVHAMSTRLKNGFDGSGIVLLKYDHLVCEAIYSKITSSVNPSVIQGEDGSIMIDYISRPKSAVVCIREGSRDALDGGIREAIPFTPPENNMIYEIQGFLHLIESQAVHHKYLQYSLDTIRVIDEIRRQYNITFPGEN